ncbi:hypothetical protein IW261DRAFT_1597416, partial [Armillaria novae-zelandiae]
LPPTDGDNSLLPPDPGLRFLLQGDDYQTREDHFCGPRLHRFLAGAAILFDLAHFAHDDDYSIVQALHEGGGGIDTSQLDDRLVVSHRRARELPLNSRPLQRRLRLLSPIEDSLNSTQAVDIPGHVNQLPCIDYGDYQGIRGLQARRTVTNITLTTTISWQ